MKSVAAQTVKSPRAKKRRFGTEHLSSLIGIVVRFAYSLNEKGNSSERHHPRLGDAFIFDLPVREVSRVGQTFVASADAGEISVKRAALP